MADQRMKNRNWTPAEDTGTVPTWERVNTALLMDIRDELQALVRIFQCSTFQGIPWDVKKLVDNTRKPTKRKSVTRLRRVA
jgi:hypothetical protein